MENIADDSFHVHPHHILQNDCTDVVGFAFFIVLTMSGSKFIMPCEVLSNVDNLIIRLWLICSFWLRISASIYMRTEIVAAFEKNIAFSCIKCYNLVYTENRRRKASMPRPPRCRRICGAPQVETFCPNGGARIPSQSCWHWTSTRSFGWLTWSSRPMSRSPSTSAWHGRQWHGCSKASRRTDRWSWSVMQSRCGIRTD